MAYEDYIPKGATLGKPVYFTKQITTGANSKVERTFFKPLLMYTFDRTIIGNNESVTNLHRIAYDTAAPHLKVPYPFIREWTTGEVFHTGSYIDVGAAIRYRYIGIDPLHLDSAPDLVKYHPSKVGFNGVRVNAKLFMPYSASIETLLSNAAGETSIKTMNNKGLRFVEDCTTGEMLSFFGLRASHAIVYIMDTSHPGKNVYEKFTVDLTYKRKLAIVAPIPQCEIFVDFYPQGFSVECSAALKSKIVNIGEMRVGHTNKTESVYKDVLSDGMVNPNNKNMGCLHWNNHCKIRRSTTS